MSLGEDQGGLPPRHTIQTEQAIIDDSLRLIREYHQPEFGGMTQIALAPCSPFSVTTELMKETAQLAKANEVMLHTHLCETIDEENFCLERFAIARLTIWKRWVGCMTEPGWHTAFISMMRKLTGSAKRDWDLPLPQFEHDARLWNLP